MADFEPIQDDQDHRPRSPDSQEVINYEEYLRREVPRFVLNALESAVNSEVEPIEERLKAQIVSLIEEAQNRAFSTYHAAHGSSESSYPLQSSRQTDSVSLQPQSGNSDYILDTFYPPPLPQNQPESSITFPELDVLLRRNNVDSDSGYGSNRSGLGSSSQAQIPSAGHASDPSKPGSTSQEQILSIRMDTSSSALMSRVPGLPETVQFSDEALGMPDAFPESSWMTDIYNTDMNQSNWNEYWTVD